ncbi:CAP domain-containing protein [Streptomyces sp. NPDC007205]|uniref:CAP domain-containing protein n=1 Tax=Streptomyces sp. NPDC007205 TaxID=3154316 RepID=UPI003408E1F9
MGSLLGAVGLLSASALPISKPRDFQDATDNAFLKQIVLTVNAVRARHGVPPVRLDDNLTKYAKSRLLEVSQGHRLGKGHKGLRSRTGEVLYWASASRKPSGSVDARNAVDRWYAEVSDYDFNSAGFSARTGHFTQLVWKESTRIGAARAVGGKPGHYERYIAVEFENPGNLVGEFKQNVFPVKRHRHGSSRR